MLVCYNVVAQWPSQNEMSHDPAEWKKWEEGVEDAHLDLEKQLYDLMLDEDEAGKVEKITLEPYEGNLDYSRREIPLAASTVDPAILNVVQYACSTRYLLRRHPGHLTGAMGVGGHFVVGELKIHTTNRVVTVFVTQIGFLFQNADNLLMRRQFHSWALAQVVNHLVAESSPGRGISRGLFLALSGEAIIEANKQLYWQTMAAARLPDTCETE
ncbi:MAG TPA: hypothetical protein DD670_04010 [Planctomycetaceae bacterium]|nr:hypothetical protein [Planctomycetaceae bacterium]